MIDPLKVTGIQANLIWEDKDSNLKNLENLVSSAPQSDLYVLPEMFSTGFSMKTGELAESMNGPTHQWMLTEAKKHNAVIAGSLIIEENSQVFNRLMWVEPSGNTLFYDKRHRFTMAGEHEHYSRGKKNVVATLKGWRIALQVCYDLRFPVWSRNRGDYDVLLFVANWPEVRKNAWSKLLEARAIENQCYVIGVNRVGEDGKGMNHSGNSVLIDPFGETIKSLPTHEENFLFGEFDYEILENYRQKFPVLKDGDDFKLLP
jgi:omega-amidase